MIWLIGAKGVGVCVIGVLLKGRVVHTPLVLQDLGLIMCKILNFWSISIIINCKEYEKWFYPPTPKSVLWTYIFGK